MYFPPKNITHQLNHWKLFFHNNFWIEFRLHWKTFLPKQKQISLKTAYQPPPTKQPSNLHPEKNSTRSRFDRHQSAVSRSCSCGTEYGTLILGESTTRRGAMQEKTGKRFSWCKCRKLVNPKRKVTGFFYKHHFSRCFIYKF